MISYRLAEQIEYCSVLKDKGIIISWLVFEILEILVN